MSYLVICQKSDCSSKAIANSVEANPSVIRNLMSDLKKANLITSHQGVAQPKLYKMPSEISIFDIYQAINTNHHLLHIDHKTNPKCIVGKNIQASLKEFYKDIEKSAEDKMKQISLQDIIDDILLRNNNSKNISI